MRHASVWINEETLSWRCDDKKCVFSFMVVGVATLVATRLQNKSKATHFKKFLLKQIIAGIQLEFIKQEMIMCVIADGFAMIVGLFACQ